MTSDMNKETIEKAARDYAEEMIGRQEGENKFPPKLRGPVMQLIQNCFKNGAIVALNSLVEMPFDEAIKELAEYAMQRMDDRKEATL